METKPLDENALILYSIQDILKSPSMRRKTKCELGQVKTSWDNSENFEGEPSIQLFT